MIDNIDIWCCSTCFSDIEFPKACLRFMFTVGMRVPPFLFGFAARWWFRHLQCVRWFLLPHPTTAIITIITNYNRNFMKPPVD